MLTARRLYRATCDPTPAIDRPEGGFELRALRRKHSKSFLLPSGLHRQIVSIGPQHYFDGGWQDIRTHLEASDSRRFECWRTPYIFHSLPNRIGCDYKSRAGGFARMRLVEVGGNPVAAGMRAEPRDNCLHWGGVALDCDVHLQLLPAKTQAWTTLQSEHSPRLFVWEFYHGGGVRIAENVRGWDAAGNSTEILTKHETTRLPSGTYRTRLTKEWTGRVFNRKNERRDKIFYEPVYPVVLDPDISEEIVDDNDDGAEAYNKWYNSNPAILSNVRNAGWRFQGIAVSQGDTIDLSTFKIYQSAAVGTAVAKMYFVDEDSAAAWSTPARPSTRAKTTAYANISFAYPGYTQRSVTVTSLVQEIVDRGGWSTGNNMACMTFGNAGTGTANFRDYPSSGKHGRLEIDYTAGGGGATAGPILLGRAMGSGRIFGGSALTC